MSKLSQELGDRAEARKIYEQRKTIRRKDKEIERLNNIIEELEKWLEDYIDNTGLGEYETGIEDGLKDTLKKIQELKERK